MHNIFSRRAGRAALGRAPVLFFLLLTGVAPPAPAQDALAPSAYPSFPPLGAGEAAAQDAAALDAAQASAQNSGASAPVDSATFLNNLLAAGAAAPVAPAPAAVPAPGAAPALGGFEDLMRQFGAAPPDGTGTSSGLGAGLGAGLPSPLLDGGELALPPSPDELQDPAALAAAAAVAAAESERGIAQDAARNRAFQEAMDQMFPLSNAQIRRLMDRLESSQAASIPPAEGVPQGISSVESISLEPGNAPPEIYLAAGYVSTVTFVDASGQPWPIVDIGLGGQYQATPTEPGAHILRLSPLTRFGSGNMSVRLEGLATPVIFTLNTQTEKVHYRYDARLPSFGPRGKAPLISGPGVQAGDGVIMALLENAPPPEARRLKVRGLDERSMAWRVGERVYLRTPLQLLSPGWSASVSSSDGTAVYDIPPAPVLLLSDSGVILRARVGEAESGNDR